MRLSRSFAPGTSICQKIKAIGPLPLCPRTVRDKRSALSGAAEVNATVATRIPAADSTAGVNRGHTGRF